MAATIDVTRLSRQFGWRSAYVSGFVAALAYSPGTIRFGELVERYGFNSVEHVPFESDIQNRIVIYRVGSTRFIGIEGTARASQWLRYVTQFGLVDDQGLERIPEFFHTNAQRALAIIKARVPSDAPIILSGHSLGGAVASITAKWLHRDGWRVQSCYTYGSPRPGNLAFANTYGIPNFRLFGANDIVPTVPPANHYVAIEENVSQSLGEFALMTHVGTPIELGDLDISEAAIGTLRDLSDIAFYRSPRGLGAHYMGSYQESIWARLSPFERGEMRLMFDILVTLGGQGIPNFPFEESTPAERVALVAEGDQSERSTIDDFVGQGAQMRFELFTAPSIVPALPTIGDLTVASFPGYSPARIPADVGRVGTGEGATETVPVVMRFGLTADLDQPVEILGAFARLDGAGQATRVPIAKRFTHPTRLRYKGDYVTVVARLKVLRVT